MKHLESCEKRTKEVNEKRKEYDLQHPNHCKECEGWGGEEDYFDPSPSGISLGAGSMAEWDSCLHCIDKGKCPRCAAEYPKDENGYFDTDKPCEACGFVECKTEGKPPENECQCYEYYQHLEEKEISSK